MAEASLKARLTVSVVTTIVAGIGAWFAYAALKPDPIAAGKDANEKAWIASFVERGLEVPKGGPREGYWGAKLGKRPHDPGPGWREPELSLPGLLEIDEFGYQHFGPAQPDHRVVFFGGSVAFGAYSSTIEKTYANLVCEALAARGLAVGTTIVAAAAWKAQQDAAACKQYLTRHRPSLVVFLNGLNDLTNGATAAAVYGERVATKDGTEWTQTYHAHDYDDRARHYLDVMTAAAAACEAQGVPVLVALQPALFEKTPRAAIEVKLLQNSLGPLGSKATLAGCYATIRTGLLALAKKRQLHFLDLSRAFDGESATTFADIWHFADPGHAILAKRMADKIATLLAE